MAVERRVYFAMAVTFCGALSPISPCGALNSIRLYNFCPCTEGKDWNERLIHSKVSESTLPPMANNAEMNQLWQWHLTAKRLGRPGGYLSRITEVARDVVRGTPLSDKAAVTMAKDMACLSQAKAKAGPEL